jgi:hypothetical protein
MVFNTRSQASFLPALLQCMRLITTDPHVPLSINFGQVGSIDSVLAAPLDFTGRLLSESLQTATA